MNPFNSQSFVKGGAVNVSARLQLCCGFSLLNIMLLFRLDRRDFFLLKQSSLVAKWFKQLHCGKAQRSYYCVCLGGVEWRGEIFGCCWCRLLTCHLPDREKKKNDSSSRVFKRLFGETHKHVQMSNWIMARTWDGLWCCCCVCIYRINVRRGGGRGHTLIILVPSYLLSSW